MSEKKRPSWLAFTMLMMSFLFFNMAFVVLAFREHVSGLSALGTLWLFGAMTYRYWRDNRV